MFEDPELQDPLALSLNENYDDQNLSRQDRKKAPSSDCGCETPGIQVVIKEEDDGWTVSDNYASYCSGRETENISPQTWHPHFKACGKESSNSYRVKGQQRLNLVAKCPEESGSHALCGPSSSAREEQQRHTLFDSDANSEISCAYGTALRHGTVNEYNNMGEKSFSCPVRETTSSHRRNMNFHQKRCADDGCFAPNQSQDVNQSTSLTIEGELRGTRTSALFQSDSPECKSPVTQELKMASSDLEGQTLRLTVRLQAGEADAEEEQVEEIGGFINSDGEVVEWDDSPDQGSDHNESPHQSKDIIMSEPRLQGQNHRFSSSPTLIMEVVGDEDEREEEEERGRIVKMTTISPLNCASTGKKRRRKNKVAEKTVAALNISDAEKQVPAIPVKRRSRRKITLIPPLYADLDSEPEISRCTKKRKNVPAIVDTEESNSKTVQHDTAKQKKHRRKKETKQSAEGEEKSAVSVGKKLPGRKRLRFPVEIPPELLKKPKEKIEYQCSVCGKEFPHAYKLERHELIHTGEKPYCCSICGRGFNQKGNLKTHYKVHFGQKGVADFEEEVNPNASELSEYLKSLPGESKIRSSLHCLECGKDCESQSALQAHHITAHTETAVESDTVEHNTSQSLLCSRCGIQFTKKEKLEEHMKTHIKEKRFACPDCGKKFINESYIQIHQRIHTGERPYLCSQCGRGFHTSSSLKLHEMQHSEERPFACSICGKTFRMNSYLMAHYQTHIIDRPFICSICGKGYSRIEELKVHHRLHTGERPYACGECGKSFIYRQGLRQHQRTHAGRRMGPTRQLGRPKQQARLDI